MKYEFIKAHAGTYQVTEMCECYDVKPSGYYAWKARKPSQRSLDNLACSHRIKELHEASGEREGHRPIYSRLQDESVRCGRDKALAMMKDMGISGAQKKTFKPQGTDSNHKLGYSPNLLKERGAPTAPDQLWVCDTTYLMVDGAWHYLATVMDLSSRRLIGWEVSESNDAELVCDALYAAVCTRGGFIPKGLVLHSDRGSTYASDKHRQALKKFGIEQSMSAKGNCYDNAAMESFYGRYKTSSVGKVIFADLEALRANVFEYIECYYNRYRKHSSLGYKTPIQIEEKNFPLGGRELGDATLHSPQATNTTTHSKELNLGNSNL
jgi:transposase InsO family protein